MSEQDPQWLSAIERQLLRKQAFDNEFEIEVAAQNNYTGADDMADVARYHGFDYLDGTRNLNLGGFYAPPDPENGKEVGSFLDSYFHRNRYMGAEVPVEVGTINAIHNKATPQIWAHEYRHRDFQNNSEGTNRLLDFATALNQDQQDSAVEMLTEYANRRKEEEDQSTNSEVLISALSALDGAFGTWGAMPYRQMLALEWDRGARSTPMGKAENINDYIDQRYDSAFFQETSDEMNEYLEWDKGLKRRNLHRAIAALPSGTPMERQFAKQERRRLLEEYDQAQ